MYLPAVTLAALLIAYLVRLAQVVHENRPSGPPRSHQHELDPVSLR
jgi:hypothetical protein